MSHLRPTPQQSYTVWGLKPGQEPADATRLTAITAPTVEQAEACLTLDVHTVEMYEVLLLFPNPTTPHDVYFDTTKQPRVLGNNRPLTDYACWMWVTMAGRRHAWVPTTLQNALLAE